MGRPVPSLLPSWCPEGVPPPVDRVLIQEKVSRVKGVPGEKQFQNREDGTAGVPSSRFLLVAQFCCVEF